MILEKLRLGAKMSFVEDGATYGDPLQTVSATVLPDIETVPAPWALNPMGCVIDSQIKKKYIEDSDICYGPNGYSEVMDRYLSMVEIGVSLKAYSEILHRLIWAVQNKMADTVAQTPFLGSDFVEGWVHLQWEADDAAPRYTTVLRARMRLDEDPKWSKDPSKPAITLEIFFGNVLNTVLPDNIIA